MKKISLIVFAAASCILSACGAGESQNKPHFYTIPNSTGKPEKPVVIQLEPLTSKEKKLAVDLGVKANALMGNSLQATYTPATHVKDLQNFYDDKENHKVLNQQQFGTCATFSTAAALGYVALGNTNGISRLNLLMQGYAGNGYKIDNPDNPFKVSGWDGAILSTVLVRIFGSEDAGFSADWYEVWKKFGKINRNGYYPENPEHTITYNKLSESYRVLKKPLEETISRDNKYFNNSLTEYMSLSNPSFLNDKVGFEFLDVSENQQDKTAVIKKSLDQQQKVLIGYTIYDSNTPQADKCENRANASGDTFYNYIRNENVDNGVLKIDENKGAKHIYNTWTQTVNNTTGKSGCVLGGHAVFIVGYFIDEKGNIIFVIRNSWDKTTGDRGNYYMTSNYANAAIHSAIALWKK